MLEKEFKYFKDNNDALFKIYPNRYLVIKGQKVVGNYLSFEEALEAAINSHKFELGTFLVQLCSEGESGYTQTFHSRVIFA